MLTPAEFEQLFSQALDLVWSDSDYQLLDLAVELLLDQTD